MFGVRLAAVVALCVIFIGCASPHGPASLQVAGDSYDHAFDTVIDVARSEAFIGGLRDRRSGVVETEPAYIATLLEPWAAFRDPAYVTTQSTISQQRRRVRFEFSPIEPVADDQAQPSFFSLGTSDVDLTRFKGDLELRVLVHVERLHRPGLRRSTWTRRVTSSTTGSDGDQPMPSRAWVPVGRDQAMEQRLLGKVQQALHRE